MTMHKSATFSDDKKYRYTLWRRWEDEYQYDPFVMFIGLNPSTADETDDDPTIRRCIGFAKEFGYANMVMTNLFAYRSTDPRGLKDSWKSPVGERNDVVLGNLARCASLIICAWGTNGDFMNRGQQVTQALQVRSNLYCLGTTKHHWPKHPLYLKKNTPLIPYSVAPWAST